MEPELLEILREAVAARQRKEELERSIGRTLRRHDLDFKLYERMISELRELSKKKGVSLDRAAAGLLAGQNEDR